jgi:predicted RNA-binding Zn ribbon-like protein
VKRVRWRDWRRETGKIERTTDNLELVGGRLCLDFANTVSAHVEGQGHEYLTTYGELVAWSRHAGVLTGDEMDGLMSGATRSPDLAAAVLERAIRLREVIYRTFSALAAQRQPPPPDLAALNAALHDALPRLELRPSARGFEWAWAEARDDLDRMVWPIVRSAADLLTSEDLNRVRVCAREGCDWLFVDTSKNRSRRWCSMSLCGSRVKARRYYRRRKGYDAAPD